MARIATTVAGIAGALAVALASAGSASAQALPTGIWMDHTGRGAVEITDCGGGALCGHIVWVKDTKHMNTCRNQVLGGVKPVGGNTWDRGWIIDPDDDAKYSVELKPVGADRLRVVGYMGSKLFSETMTWKRAPADLQRCDGKSTPDATPASAPAAPQPVKPNAAAPYSPPSEDIVSPGQIAAPSAPPRRQAAAPAVIPPAATVNPAAPVYVSPIEQTTPPARSAEAAPPVEDAAPEPAIRGGKKKSGNRNCTIDLPYITLTYPCDAF